MSSKNREEDIPKEQPLLKAADISEDIQARVFEVAQDALQKYTLEKEIASFIKKEMDQLYGHTWHCIVGKSFGSYVSHESGGFVYFYIGSIAFLVFKTI
ncbi:Dynein light chain [Komagataella phaffii CBS 7435]|uniref:Dynein light chain n=2 Tax=Komagataella phaffii TaxID=460519 RepID=C4R375_KOMPG|nr:Cytoplasmic light chain dynein, microtubule motor protein [Komagataella phaffii GS115]CAH2448944.1 Dynein light chain [Komagataella phaffii CBS 7435]CAY71209.1 Cytoplasmic light chain dynein, microtubule motor protein [Komagataella phaffii GS115]CCA38996.1 Dynein light chain [Komagataella phaffii CBS 7435]